MGLIKGKQILGNTLGNREIDTATDTVSTVNAGDAAVDGASDAIANKLHQHAVATAAPPAASVSAAAAAEGSASDLMRSDASLQADVSGTLDSLAVGASGSDGTGDGLALKTHEHAVPAASAAEITDSTNSAGSSGSFVHSDHQHAHGVRGGGTLHAAATSGTAGFMSAADKTKLDAAQNLSEIDAKESCQVRAQGDLTLSGEQTIDGILTSADRVLVDQQGTPSEDGIYVTSSGAWSRSADMPTGTEARGVRVWIEEGTADGQKLYACSNVQGADVVGTDGLTFGLIGAGSPRGAGDGCVLNGNDIDVVANGDASIVVNANDIQVGVLASDAQHGTRGGGTQHSDVVAAGASGFMTGGDKTKIDGVDAGAEVNDTPRQEVVTTQAITGTDTEVTDTLDNTPISNASVRLFLNGILQRQGAGNDYTLSGVTITWLASSGTAVDMEADDQLDAVYLS
jgi:hypothetical protein